jgi:DNA modification methylase
VIDPFFGAGTVGVVCNKLNRKYHGIELKQDYIDIANRRLRNVK